MWGNARLVINRHPTQRILLGEGRFGAQGEGGFMSGHRSAFLAAFFFVGLCQAGIPFAGASVGAESVQNPRGEVAHHHHCARGA